MNLITMEKKQIILVNTESNNSNKVINYLIKNNIKFYSDKDINRSRKLIRRKLVEGYSNFIVCGGDGSINKFINEYCKLPKIKREKISLGIIPCGRANDLARAMNIPFDIKKAFDLIKNNISKKIDIIKVNDAYFITGGGLGLPAEIIKDVNGLSRNIFTKFIKNILGESIYLWITLKKFVVGYKGINDSKDRLLAIYVLNQSFIGKNFHIAPEAINSDGFFNIKFVKIPPTFLSKFKTLSKGSSGKIDELDWVKSIKSNKIKIKLKQSSYFMGDGELLDKSNIFEIDVLPSEISIISN